MRYITSGIVCTLPRPPPAVKLNLSKASGPSIYGFPSPRLARFALAQRARTAFLALSDRSWGVSLAALARPPFFPPFRPSATACGFFAMTPIYVGAYVKSSKICLDTT